MPGFRFNAISVFLTYPQCPLSKDEILKAVDNINKVATYVVARELHEDGNPHLHLFMKFERKLNFTDPNHFDVKQQGVTYHPNIQKPRNWKDVIKYVKKGGDYIAHQEIEELMLNKSWKQIMAEAKNTKEFMNLVLETYPKDYCLAYDRLKSMAEQHFKSQDSLSEPIATPGGMTVPAQAESWLNTEVLNFEQVRRGI